MRVKIDKIFLATANAKKRREIEAILAPLDVTVVTEEDVGPIGEVVEDGETFEANAVKKAREGARRTGLVSLADDSGLEVDALGGAPGVHSSRYAGEDAGDPENVRKLLAAMAEVPAGERTARFRCVIALAAPGGEGDATLLVTAEGRVEGRILGELRGENGFGYDPVFFYEPLGKTFAELTMEEKAAVSHRGRALAELTKRLRALMADM